MPNEHLTDATKHIIDGASIATAIGTMMQVLPAIAALFTIVWTLIRIYETKTVQKLLGKHKG
jgi:glycerol-3-phosphate acyltransferase PlsY